MSSGTESPGPVAAAPSPEAVREAAQALSGALFAHLDAVEQRTGEDDPVVVSSYRALRTATEDYEDLLFDAYAEVPPFVVLEWTEEDDLEDDLVVEPVYDPDHDPEDPTAM